MELAGAGAGMIVAILVFLAVLGAVILIGAAFLLWAAGIVGIQRRSWGKAIAVVILGAVISLGVSMLLSTTPVMGPGLGFVAGFVVEALIMMPIFDTTFGKALAASLLAWALSLLVIGGIVLLLMLAGISVFALGG